MKDLPDDVASYYANVIKGQPGANEGEQAGSAKYYLDMIRDREYGPSGYVGSAAKGGGGGQDWLNEAGAGYSDFAKTGAFSPEDIQDIRARAISPIRRLYDSAQRGLNRSRRLSGYSPNYNAATTKMAREMGYAVGDANENVNADIAQIGNENRGNLADEFENLTWQALKLAKGKAEDASYQQLVTGAAIGADKSQLLRGQPTQIIDDSARMTAAVMRVMEKTGCDRRVAEQAVLAQPEFKELGKVG